MIIESINKEWEWLNITAVEIIDQNGFGNLIFRSTDGSYWRILPENPECIKIANTAAEFEQLKRDNEFKSDWEMANLIALAEQKSGALEKGRKYCLKVPAFFGGLYTEQNLGTISQEEQISFSGNIVR